MAVLLKLLLVVALVVVLFGWTRRPRRTARSAVPRALPPVTMVACAECGLHVPQADALTASGDGAAYCSPAHRAAARSRRPTAPR